MNSIKEKFLKDASNIKWGSMLMWCKDSSNNKEWVECISYETLKTYDLTQLISISTHLIRYTHFDLNCYMSLDEREENE